MSQLLRHREAGDDRLGVLIVDDHPLLRHGLSHIIDGTPDFVTCGQAANISSALEVLERAAPHLAVVDLSLGSGSGLDLIREIRRRRPKLGVLVLSMLDEAVYADRALRAGADGYIMKGAETSELLDAIRRVSTGHRYLSPRLREDMAAAGEEHGSHRVRRLTDREFAVFEGIGRGLGTRDIARRLGVSVKTVETHRLRIKEKLGFKAATEMVHYAVRWLEDASRG